MVLTLVWSFCNIYSDQSLEPCSVCQVLASERKANNFEYRKQAEIEKVRCYLFL